VLAKSHLLPRRRQAPLPRRLLQRPLHPPQPFRDLQHDAKRCEFECRVRRQIAYLRKGDDTNPKSALPFGVWLWMSGGARPQLGMSLRGHRIS
jgi:hypothetical protein